jgi:hypothetical protein
MRRLVLSLIVAAGLAGFGVTSAGAHNAGHFFLPSGQCLEVGGFNQVFPGPEKTTALDLDPSTPSPPFDEIGTSFAGFQGNTPIEPGPCPR